jgi:hypothetical protein
MSTIRPIWLVRRTKVVAISRAAFHQHSRTDIRGCNDNVVAQNQEFRLSPSRLHTGSAVVRQLLAAEEVVGTLASVDLAAAIRKLASVALKARRQT